MHITPATGQAVVAAPGLKRACPLATALARVTPQGYATDRSGMLLRAASGYYSDRQWAVRARAGRLDVGR